MTPEWINKSEAATQLKVAERTVLSLAAEGKIQSKKMRNERNQMAVMFNAADVERYGFERDNPAVRTNGSDKNGGSFDIMQGSQAVQLVSATHANLPPVYAHHTRGEITDRHSTEHYRIKEWVKPAADSPFFKFYIEGPGAMGRVYIALDESCGPDLIKGLESAYMAGLAGFMAGAPRNWITVEKASELTGLPESAILHLIEARKLPALDLDNGQSRKGGGRIGGRYRVSRRDLDKLEGE